MKRRTQRRSQRGGRRAALALVALLMGLLVVGPSAPPAHADACDGLIGMSKSECEKYLQGDDNDPVSGDCKSPPLPERPDEGVAGYFNDPPKRAPKPIDVKPPNEGSRFLLYQTYGFAGLSWNDYDTGCMPDVGAFGETHLANIVGSVTTWFTGLAVELRKQAVEGTYVKKLDGTFALGSSELGAVARPWLPVSIALVAVLLVAREARRGDLASIVRSMSWIALLLGVSGFVALYPTAAGSLADGAINSTIGQIQRDVVPATAAVGYNNDPAASQGNMLVGGVLYEEWLRGELGSTTSPVARKYGIQLYDAQSLSWAELRMPDKERKAIVKKKGETWSDIAKKVKDEDHGAYQYLTGKKSGRLMDAIVAGIGAIPNNGFSIAASVILILGKLILRLAIMILPAVIPIAMSLRTAPAFTTLARVVGASVVNCVIFAGLASLELIVVQGVLNPSLGIPGWMSVVLMWIVTAVLWGMGRPFRSLTTMVRPNHNVIGEGTSTMTKLGWGAARFGAGLATGYAAQQLGTRGIRRWLGKAGNGDDDPAREEGDSYTYTTYTGWRTAGPSPAGGPGAAGGGPAGPGGPAGGGGRGGRPPGRGGGSPTSPRVPVPGRVPEEATANGSRARDDEDGSDPANPATWARRSERPTGPAAGFFTAEGLIRRQTGTAASTYEPAPDSTAAGRGESQTSSSDRGTIPGPGRELAPGPTRGPNREPAAAPGAGEPERLGPPDAGSPRRPAQHGATTDAPAAPTPPPQPAAPWVRYDPRTRRYVVDAGAGEAGTATAARSTPPVEERRV